MNFFSMRVLLSRLKAIRFMMVDKKVSIFKKLLVVAGILYLFLPIDLIPVLAFPLSLVDDIAAWLLILWLLKDTLDTYWDGGKTNDYSTRFNKDDIIDDAEYEVKEDKKK